MPLFDPPNGDFQKRKKTKECLKNEINVIKCIVYSDYRGKVIILIIKELFKLKATLMLKQGRSNHYKCTY